MKISNRPPIKSLYKKILILIQVRYLISICAWLLAICTPVAALAQESPIRNGGDYYDAICDFIIARQYEATSLAVEGPEIYKNKIKNILIAENAFDLNRYKDKNISIDYISLSREQLPKIVNISIKSIYSNYTKSSISRRFGVTDITQSEVTFGCDASQMKIIFSGTSVYEIVINNQF